MTKLTSPPGDRRRDSHRGRFYYYDSGAGIIAVAWPRKRKRYLTPAQRDTQRLFQEACRAVKLMHPDFQVTAREAVEGTQYLPRDLLFKFLYGRTQAIQLPDGRIIRPMARRVDISDLLDNIASDEGSLMYRGADLWLPIPPGNIDDVLTFRAGTGEAPIQWRPNAGGGGGGEWFDPPSAYMFPNSINSPTLIDSPRGLGVVGIAVNRSLCVAYKTIDPALPLTVTARIQPNFVLNGLNGAGVMFGDATTGRWVQCGFASSGASYIYEMANWTDAVTSPSGAGGPGSYNPNPPWVQVTYNPAVPRLETRWSLDGVTWTDPYNNTWLGVVDRLGVGVTCRVVPATVPRSTFTLWQET